MRCLLVRALGVILAAAWLSNAKAAPLPAEFVERLSSFLPSDVASGFSAAVPETIAIDREVVYADGTRASVAGQVALRGGLSPTIDVQVEGTNAVSVGGYGSIIY
ncbi:MAG: hypothetical protein RLW62_16420, partial [Gammaproteobacteria bacterium]